MGSLHGHVPGGFSSRAVPGRGARPRRDPSGAPPLELSRPGRERRRGDPDPDRGRSGCHTDGGRSGPGPAAEERRRRDAHLEGVERGHDRGGEGSRGAQGRVRLDRAFPARHPQGRFVRRGPASCASAASRSTGSCRRSGRSAARSGSPIPSPRRSSRPSRSTPATSPPWPARGSSIPSSAARTRSAG